MMYYATKSLADNLYSTKIQDLKLLSHKSAKIGLLFFCQAPSACDSMHTSVIRSVPCSLLP